MGAEASQSGSPFVFPFSKSAGRAEVTGVLLFPLDDSDKAGNGGMGDELEDWLGRFRALNLGTTATLTLRRGMFCGRQVTRSTVTEGEAPTIENNLEILLISNAIITVTGYFVFGVVIVLGFAVTKVHTHFLVVVNKFPIYSSFSSSD